MGDEVAADRRATIEEQEAYETLRIKLREAEGRMHPAKAHLVDLKALAFIVDALVAVDAGEKMPAKPNVPPVARPGRGRGMKLDVKLTPEEQAEVDRLEAEERAAEEAEAAAVEAQRLAAEGQKPRNDEDDGDGA